MSKLDDKLVNWKALKYRIREEGIDYCFESYSDWLEIVDDDFHNLRKDYLEISRKLKLLIDGKITEIENKITEEE
jgi:hypothetical protein